MPGAVVTNAGPLVGQSHPGLPVRPHHCRPVALLLRPSGGAEGRVDQPCSVLPTVARGVGLDNPASCGRAAGGRMSGPGSWNLPGASYGCVLCEAQKRQDRHYGYGLELTTLTLFIPLVAMSAQ